MGRDRGRPGGATEAGDGTENLMASRSLGSVTGAPPFVARMQRAHGPAPEPRGGSEPGEEPAQVFEVVLIPLDHGGMGGVEATVDEADQRFGWEP